MESIFSEIAVMAIRAVGAFLAVVVGVYTPILLHKINKRFGLDINVMNMKKIEILAEQAVHFAEQEAIKMVKEAQGAEPITVSPAHKKSLAAGYMKTGLKEIGISLAKDQVSPIIEAAVFKYLNKGAKFLKKQF